ncbi:hypothetical protein OF83DRAFT_1069423, partial [Amylostereum chailletii]
PISQLAPIVSQAFFATTYLFSRSWDAFRSISVVPATLFSFLLRPIIFILSPFIVAIQLLFGIFIYTPYRTTIYVAEALYPLYVFLVVAVVSGILVGLVARQGVSFVGWSLLGRAEHMKAPVSSRPVDGSRGATKGKRRAAVKIEAPNE